MAVETVSLTSDAAGTEVWNMVDSIYRRYMLGTLVEERPFNSDDAGWKTVVQALDAMDNTPAISKLRTALLTNRAYLAKVDAGTAVTADHLAQVSALTRQMAAVLLRTVLETH